MLPGSSKKKYAFFYKLFIVLIAKILEKKSVPHKFISYSLKIESEKVLYKGAVDRIIMY